MIEKLIQLEGVNLVDFLGVENKNIHELAAGFPTGQIIARGKEIKIRGSAAVVAQVYEILQRLLTHYHNYEVITQELVHHCIHQEVPDQALILPSEPTLHGPRGRLIKPKTISQPQLVAAMAKHTMAFAIGPAGTGKTYMAVALALQGLKNKEVKKIIITRPIVEAGENLGFLPGYLEDKIAPYLRPIYDALEHMLSLEKRKDYQEQGIIEVAPLAYMRGRTLHDSFVILDEAQNTNNTQMEMFLTRMGMHSKFIITGDITQIDLPQPSQSGLLSAMDVLKHTTGIAFIYFNEHDVMRPKLVKSILKAYEQRKRTG